LSEYTRLKQEMLWLAAGYLGLTAALFIAFQKSSLAEVLRTTASLYWMFVLPGYALALCSRQGFVERLIIGIAIQAAVFGLASYYAGLLGWHVAMHGWVLPLASIAVGIMVRRKAA
jgi:hypothetical protein